MTARVCDVEGCDRRHKARSMCMRHYQSHWFHSRPIAHTGWSRRLADDVDEAVVLRLMDGGRPASFTSFERREAVRRLVARGVPKVRVADQIGMHKRQVYRDLKWLAAHDASPVSALSGVPGTGVAS